MTAISRQLTNPECRFTLATARGEMVAWPCEMDCRSRKPIVLAINIDKGASYDDGSQLDDMHNTPLEQGWVIG